MGLCFQCAVALTQLTNMLAIFSEFLSCSVDAGFVLVLPLHHRDLELDSGEVSTKDHVAILVAWPCLGYLRDKNTRARTLTENVGGLICKVVWKSTYCVCTQTSNTHSVYYVSLTCNGDILMQIAKNAWCTPTHNYNIL